MVFIISFIRLVLLLSLAIAAVMLVLSNDANTALSLHPLPFELSAPLYAIITGGFIAGLVLGGVLSYAGYLSKTARYRKEAKQAKRTASALETEIKSLRLQQELARKQQEAHLIAPSTVSLSKAS